MQDEEEGPFDSVVLDQIRNGCISSVTELDSLFTSVIQSHSQVRGSIIIMDVEYLCVVIITGVANMYIIYCIVCSSSRRGEGNGDGWGVCILASYKFHFLRVDENLVQHQST